jgi:hypothetical protein
LAVDLDGKGVGGVTQPLEHETSAR